VPFSSRLRRLVIRSVEVVGFKGFEGVGVEKFVELLDRLHVTVKDVDNRLIWVRLLLDTLQFSEGTRHLSRWYLELLMESSYPQWGGDLFYNPQITISLVEAQEWDKLECWIGTVWIMWPPGTGQTLEEDLERLMVLLFRQRPGAARKLTQWVESVEEVPESFGRISQKAQEAVQWGLW